MDMHKFIWSWEEINIDIAIFQFSNSIMSMPRVSTNIIYGGKNKLILNYSKVMNLGKQK